MIPDKISMTFWAKGYDRDVSIIPGIIKILEEVSGRCCDWMVGKQPPCPIPISTQGWEELLHNKRDEEDGSLTLFVASPAGGMMIGIGLDWPVIIREFDVLTLDLDLAKFSNGSQRVGIDAIFRIFTGCVSYFRPFYAFIFGNGQGSFQGYQEMQRSIDVTKVPVLLHWFNYFESAMVDRLGGKDRLQAIPFHRVETWQDPPGIVVVMDDEPFDFTVPDDRQRYEELVAPLCLPRLHARYPRVRKSARFQSLAPNGSKPPA